MAKVVIVLEDRENGRLGIQLAGEPSLPNLATRPERGRELTEAQKLGLLLMSSALDLQKRLHMVDNAALRAMKTASEAVN